MTSAYNKNSKGNDKPKKDKKDKYRKLIERIDNSPDEDVAFQVYDDMSEWQKEICIMMAGKSICEVCGQEYENQYEHECEAGG